jgi:hypothetical protein
MATQSGTESYADLMVSETAKELRSIVGAGLSDNELARMGDELIEFFEALGEENDTPEGGA